MNRHLAIAAVLLTIAAGMAATTTVSAASADPPIYRCGNSYSQTPCPGARRLGAVDGPDEADRVQAERRAADDRLLAERMERARLRQEARIKPALATGFDSRAAAASPPAVVLVKPQRSHRREGVDEAPPDGWKRDAFVAVVPRDRRP